MGLQAPRKCGRQRSLVRMLSSLLPLRPAPRIFFNIVKNPSNVYDFERNTLEKEINLKPGEHQLSFQKCEMSPSQLSAIPDLLEFGSKPDDSKLKDEDVKEDGVVTQKIDNLERELQQLREQMARIMAAQIQAGKIQDSHKNPVTASSSVPSANSHVPSAPALPPPPPPPPPPLPPMNLPITQLTIKKRTTDQKNSVDTPKRPTGVRLPVDMADVLKDMGKVKLRRVERSPGGTPLRQAPPPTDPNTVLMQVLKRRYAAMHEKTPEKLQHYIDSDSSFSEDNFCSPIRC